MSPEAAQLAAQIEADSRIVLADGRTALEVHEEELAADRRFERGLLVKELISFMIVIAVILIRQRWFV